MIATTIEQSKKLVELGIDPNSADCFYEYYDENEYIFIPDNKWANIEVVIPAWSCEALLKLLPPYLEIKINNSKIRYNLIIEYKPPSLFMPSYYSFNTGDYYIFQQKVDSLIENCFNMIMWLKTKNYY